MLTYYVISFFFFLLYTMLYCTDYIILVPSN